MSATAPVGPPLADGTDRRRAALAAGSLAVVAWAFGPLIVRGIGASTPTTVFWRLWAAQPVMTAVAYLTGGRLSRAVLRQAAVPGVLFALSMYTSFASYQYTSIANATLIGSLEPAVILFVAPRLFGDRPGLRQKSLAAVAFALLVADDLGAVRGLDWLLVALMVIGPGLLGHGSMTWAQKHLDITTASLLTLGHPVVATLAADAREPAPEVVVALPVPAD